MLRPPFFNFRGRSSNRSSDPPRRAEMHGSGPRSDGRGSARRSMQHVCSLNLVPFDSEAEILSRYFPEEISKDPPVRPVV
jgi:hypothetical protein